VWAIGRAMYGTAGKALHGVAKPKQMGAVRDAGRPFHLLASLSAV
jgi:hypothetical protein